MYKATKNFTSGRDDKGNLIQFIKGEVYDLSKYPSEKVSKIKKNFTEVKNKEVAERKEVERGTEKAETASVNPKSQKRGGK